MSKYRFTDGAKIDFKETLEWYYEENPPSADKFEIAVQTALEVICQSPTRWPKLRGGYRYYLLDPFPVSVIYRVVRSEIEVVAVAHAKRKPGYWRHRNGHS